MKKIVKSIIPILVIIIYIAFLYLTDFVRNGKVDTVKELIIENSLFFVFTTSLILIVKKIWKNQKEKYEINLLVIIAICFAYPGIRLLYDRLIFIVKDLLEVDYELEISMESLNRIETIDDIISGIIFAPVIEELLFRKIPIITFKSKAGKIYGIFMSSFIFAMSHNYQSRWHCFFMGIIFSIIFLVTNNIKITILLHALSNGMSTILFFISRSIGDTSILSYSGSSIYCNTKILMMGFCITIISIYIYTTYVRRHLVNEGIKDM